MEKKPNRFSRVLIVILIVFIATIVISSFILGESKFSLTNEIILLILLLVVLALSEVFDNFSIGNLITAKKEKHEKEVELKEAKSENNELRTQLISIVSNSITNRNMNIFGLSKDDWVQMAGVEQAESSAVEEKKEEDLVVDKKSFADDSGKRRRMLPKIEKIAIDRFCTQHKIPILSVVREVKINFAPVSMNMYNLYYLLSKVYYYRKANQLHAKVVLILPNLPESYWKDRWYSSISKVISNLQETFAPAIKNNLLEIVPIEITQGDLDTINKEIEAQERGSGD